MCLEYIRRAWKIYTKNLTSFLEAGLVMFAVFIVLLFSAVSFFFAYEYPFYEEALVAGAAHADSVERLAMLALFFASLFALFLLQLGLYGMGIESLRRRARLKTMFITIRKYFLRYIAASAVVLLCYLAAFALTLMLFAPFSRIISVEVSGFALAAVAVLLSVFFVLVYPAIADGRGVSETFALSFSAAKKNYLELFALLLFFGALQVLVNFVTLLGILLSYFVISPLAAITFSMYYRRKCRKR